MTQRWITSATLVAALALAAQPAAAQAFDLGGSVLFSRLSKTSAAYDRGSDVGYRVGVNLRLGRMFFVQPGVHYQEEGFKLERTSAPVVGRDRVAIRSWYVPVQVGVNLGVPAVGLKFSAGPTVKFVTGANTNDFPLGKDDFAKTQWGGTVNAQARLLFFSVDVGYDAGFTKAFKDTAGFGDGTVNTFRVGLGFFF